MVSGLSLLQLVGLALLAGLGIVFSNAVKLILEKEYTSWAPALARLLTRLAGVLHPSRGGQWWADLLYQQKVKSETGLFQAGSCLASAAALSLCHGVAVAKTSVQRRRNPFVRWRVRGRASMVFDTNVLNQDSPTNVLTQDSPQSIMSFRDGEAVLMFRDGEPVLMHVGEQAKVSSALALLG